MAGLWLLVVDATAVPTPPRLRAPVLAGALLAIATELKLTAATYAVGLCAAF